MGDEFHQVLFDLHGVRLFGEGESAAEACDMGIDHDADIQPEGITEHDVGGFASDAGEGGEGFHGIRHLALVPFYEQLAAGSDVLGLIPKEAGGTDGFFEFLGLGFGKGVCVGEALKEVGSDEVDPAVGALGGEDGRDEQLQGGVVVEGALGLRIVLVEECADLEGPCLLGLEGFAWEGGISHGSRGRHRLGMV